ncbi:hypothetical protein [Rothia nasimurium]|uniref:hypothetical protein n=2 Tax=Rothia nasimurium TaxID=85336 RepID=UPI001F34EE72|nr:hypothetical protein [Rothia nasimurium]
MLTTLAWFGFSFIINLILIRKPMISVGLVVAAYALVPLNAVEVTQLARPGDYFFISFLIIFIIRNYEDVKQTFIEHQYLTVFSIFVSAVTFIARFVGVGGLGTSIIFIIFLPFMMFIVVKTLVRTQTNLYKQFNYILIPLTLFEIALGWRQYVTGEPILWESVLSQQWWWGNNFVVTQPIGTFGHWIPYSMFLGMTIAFTSRTRSPILWPILTFGSMFLVILTAARSGIIAFVLSALIILIREFKELTPAKILAILAMIPIIGFVSINAFNSEISQTLRLKLVDDGNSTTLRLDAIEWFWNNTHLFALTGMPGGLDLRAEGILKSSLENAFYFHAVAYGLLSAILLALFFVFATVITLKTKGAESYFGFLLAVAFGISTFTYGAFGGGEFTTLYMFWIAQAIAQSKSLQK